ncbi:MAG: hypothetical protein ABJA66_11170 [Actinomycetota bacterium]
MRKIICSSWLILILIASSCLSAKFDYNKLLLSDSEVTSIYEQNKDALNKLMEMLQEDLKKIEPDSKSTPTRHLSFDKNCLERKNCNVTVSPERHSEYDKIISKLPVFSYLYAQSNGADLFFLHLTLSTTQEKKQSEISCDKGLYYSAKPHQTVSLPLDSTDCKSLMATDGKGGTFIYRGLQDNWYLFMNGIDNSHDD